MGEYGQFCPVAKATEVLDQRWTLLVVRELLAGSNRFNDLHRGVPRMSRTLLSQRLHALVRAGLVDRHEGDGGPTYELTATGWELEPVLDALGRWGVRWMGSPGEEDLDPALLVWDMHRRVDSDAIPDGRTVVRLRFPDVLAALRDWWLVITREEVDVCESDPGFDVDVAIEAPIRTMVEVWRGDIGWDDALRGGLRLSGPEHLRRRVDAWFRLSEYASVPRAAATTRHPEPATPDRG
ncbi:transcriptional regulator [Egibacter rhizosphaerae]|uniref:Transcriptional regulator n=1 Tax=Egibacter rhizosphaerae TaxID=1670831 RepID=A0A411YJF1_9ACTN|nr:helix-turn-helix domain-containing protein [Egibacter rhizosphaerae]QBI21343.1 transcriptional regulator [Egibacter rhizosphaerae]